MSDVLPQWLRNIIVCPACHASLSDTQDSSGAATLTCAEQTCGLSYPIRDNIPVLLVDEASRPNQQNQE